MVDEASCEKQPPIRRVRTDGSVTGDMDDFETVKSSQSKAAGRRSSAKCNVRKSVYQLQSRSSAHHGQPPPPQSNLFGDSCDMKAKLHENIDKKDYDVQDLYSTEGWAQALARNEHFGSLTLFVIAANAVWIGVDTDHNKAVTLADAELQFQIAENFFCIVFSFEFAVRFLAFKRKRDCMTDAWFRFDGALVALMISETWIIPFAVGGGGGSGGMSNVSMLRLLRLLRLTRLVRIMRSIPELITMLKGFVAATRSVSATLTMLVIALYIFAIVFSQQLADVEAMNQEFGSIPRSMWTLLLGGTFLDNLTAILMNIADNGGPMAPMMVCLFLIFVLLSSLTILNMLIGVLCEVVSAVAAAEREKAIVTYVKTQLIDVLTELDKDGTGTVSRTELEGLVQVPSAVEALQQLGVDIPNLLQLSEVIFDMEGHGDAGGNTPTGGDGKMKKLEDDQLDGINGFGEEGEGGGAELSFAEFLEMVMRLRSENTASVPDIVDLRKFIRLSNTRQGEKLSALRVNLTNLENDIARVRRETCDSVEEVREDMRTVHSALFQSLAATSARIETLVLSQKAQEALADEWTSISTPLKPAIVEGAVVDGVPMDVPGERAPLPELPDIGHEYTSTRATSSASELDHAAHPPPEAPTKAVIATATKISCREHPW